MGPVVSRPFTQVRQTFSVVHGCLRIFQSFPHLTTTAGDPPGLAWMSLDILEFSPRVIHHCTVDPAGLARHHPHHPHIDPPGVALPHIDPPGVARHYRRWLPPLNLVGSAFPSLFRGTLQVDMKASMHYAAIPM